MLLPFVHLIQARGKHALHPPTRAETAYVSVRQEQILELTGDRVSGLPQVSSILQLRGSIPVLWGHRHINTQRKPKPDITLEKGLDPEYTSTRKHFEVGCDGVGCKHVAAVGAVGVSLGTMAALRQVGAHRYPDYSTAV